MQHQRDKNNKTIPMILSASIMTVLSDKLKFHESYFQLMLMKNCEALQ